MPSIFIEASKYVIGLIAGAMGLIVLSWLNSPSEDDIEFMIAQRISQIEQMIDKRTLTMDQVRAEMEKGSPWTKERLLIISRLDGMDRTDTSHSLRVDAMLSKMDNMQSKSEAELRSIHNSMYRILAKLDLMDESKKKEGEEFPQ